MCFACNSYFTGNFDHLVTLHFLIVELIKKQNLLKCVAGEGVGYNPVEDRTTMNEWIVRGESKYSSPPLSSSHLPPGDSQTKIADLKASRLDLWP